MRLHEAMVYARTGVRQRSWAAGLRIRWHDDRLRWEWRDDATAWEAMPEMQGVLTPSTMKADDWEAVDEKGGR